MAALKKVIWNTTLEADRKVFLPLLDFMAADRFPAEALEETVRRYRNTHMLRRGDIGEAKGLVAECYVKWALARFAEINPVILSASRFAGGAVEDVIFYNTPGSGMIFRLARDGPRDIHLAELDALYEFRSENAITPVVFEAKYALPPRARNIAGKKALVTEIYGKRPIVCIIGTGQNALLGRDGSCRMMSIPRRREFDELASGLATASFLYAARDVLCGGYHPLCPEM
ncbi:MAG: hypothetical protein AB1324_02260 [Candidatus Micrarchaeota archaeon]